VRAGQATDLVTEPIPPPLARDDEETPRDRRRRALLTRWWVILAGAILGGVVAFAIVSAASPAYEADARLLAGPIAADDDTLRAAGQLGRTYAALATSRPILDAVIKEKGLDITSDELAEKINTSSNDVTRIVLIRVTDQDPEEAAAIANLVATKLQTLTNAPSVDDTLIDEVLRQRELFGLTQGQIELVRRALVRVLQESPTGELTTIEPAVPPASPTKPQRTLWTLLGVVGGALLAAVGVLVYDARRDPVGGRLEAMALRGPAATQTLGTVELRRDDSEIVVASRSGSPDAERFRVLAAKLQSVVPGGAAVLISDCRGGRDAALLAANVGAALAESGVEVIVVDADGDARRVSQLLGLPAAELPAGGLDGQLDDGPVADRLLDAHGVRLLPVGASVRLLEPERARRLLARVGKLDPQIVLVVAGSADATGNALIWAGVTGDVLLTVSTLAPRGGVERSLANLRTAGVDVLRLVSLRVRAR
jgi:Mrp family chromosome partitioning ATPase